MKLFEKKKKTFLHSGKKIIYNMINTLSCAGALMACERYQPALEPRAGRGSDRVYSGSDAGPLPPLVPPPPTVPPRPLVVLLISPIASCWRIHCRTVLAPFGSRLGPPLRGTLAKGAGAATI